MTDSPIHNLDEGLLEYFDFIVKGHTYRFRHPNTKEMEKMKDVKADEAASRAQLFQFITTVSEDAPEFSTIVDDLTVPYWKRFNEMIRKEMGLDGQENIQSPTAA